MTEPIKRVLLVEDDVPFVDTLRAQLVAEGHAVECVRDGRLGLQKVERGGWDAIVLNSTLPGIDSLEICRRARERSLYTSVIVVSPRGGEVHRILALEMGADDYLVKPFSVPELVARLKALLRRVDAISNSLRGGRLALEEGGLQIDRSTRQVQLHGQPVELTPREFDLLLHFAQNPGRVFSRLELLHRVWGTRHEGYEHTVNTHINRLRAKIEPDPRNPTRIVTVWGSGYKFCPRPRDAVGST